jgi:beta-glucanase (GH16 family)
MPIVPASAIRLLLVLASLAAVLPAEDGAAPPRDPAYRLVWADEFDGEGPPDPANWRFERGFVRNQELQFYTERNAWRENGLLVIEGRRERLANPGFREGSRDWRASRREAHYTSASITTHGRRAFTYGRFEVRARFAPLQGLWPAIWSTGARRGTAWPHGGEIDLMEFYSGRLYANLCWAGARGQAVWNTGSHSIERFDRGDFAAKFHLWVMEWTPAQVDLYFNGQLLNRQELAHVRNQSGPQDFHPFRHPHGILLNLAIGSSGGNPAPTAFPQRYEIDHVRVWQKPGEGSVVMKDAEAHK